MTGQAGVVAYIALLAWLPISFLAFALLQPRSAALFTILGAMLFLPEGVSFKFPYLPYLDKHNIPYLCVFLGAVVRAPGKMLRMPRQAWFLVFGSALLFGSVGTALTNHDILTYGRTTRIVLPALTVKDGFFTGVTQSLAHTLPFFVGLSLFRRPEDLRQILRTFALAGLAYVPFALIEIRLSPQFHYWLYGYHQHSFLQTLRWGGYRPMVFMPHGLALARFLVVAMLGAFVGVPAGGRIAQLPAGLVTFGLWVTLVLCKSTGAIVYGTAALGILMLCKAELRTIAAVSLAAAVLLYPALRATDALPVSQILSAAEVAGSDREQSLLFRFQNEDELLDKARKKIIFGWGEYDRSSLFDEMGRPRTVTDGHWIVLVAVTGLVGFVSAFGMLLAPIFIARGKLRRIRARADRMLVSGVALMIGAVALDLIPNGLWDGYPYLLAGSLVAVTATLVRAESKMRRAVALVAQPS